MKNIIRKAMLGVAILLILLLAYGIYFIYHDVAPIGAGYKAKLLCSAVFVAKRDPATVQAEELSPQVNPLLHFVSAEVDYEAKTATARAFGLVKRTAAFREGLGCTVLPVGWTRDDLKPARVATEILPADPAKTPWPTGDRGAVGALPPGVDAKRLAAAVDGAFVETDLKHPKRTRAVVVVYKGRIIAERYGPGFTKDTPQHGWSMSKSVTNALAGILVREGKIDIDAPAPVKEWKSPGDPRSAITISHMLRMSSGLDFHTDLSPVGDRQKQLFGAIDVAASSVQPKLLTPPGTFWEYSNANPLTIQKIFHETLGDNAYAAFPRQALFNRIGMRNTVIEPDPYGTYIGSSFTWATPRDWARLGILFLNDGVWEGKRVLPAGWVAFTRAPAPADPRKHYGAFFWLNADNSAESAAKKASPPEPPFPELPKDAFFAMGMWDQKVTIIPSCDLVVVRMGLTHTDGAFDTGKFIRGILDSIGKPAK